MATILESAVRQSQDNFAELRVLDLGAGNGMMGEELKKQGLRGFVWMKSSNKLMHYPAIVVDSPML